MRLIWITLKSVMASGGCRGRGLVGRLRDLARDSDVEKGGYNHRSQYITGIYPKEREASDVFASIARAHLHKTSWNGR